MAINQGQDGALTVARWLLRLEFVAAVAGALHSLFHLLAFCALCAASGAWNIVVVDAVTVVAVLICGCVDLVTVAVADDKTLDSVHAWCVFIGGIVASTATSCGTSIAWAMRASDAGLFRLINPCGARPASRPPPRSIGLQPASEPLLGNDDSPHQGDPDDVCDAFTPCRARDPSSFLASSPGNQWWTAVVPRPASEGLVMRCRNSWTYRLALAVAATNPGFLARRQVLCMLFMFFGTVFDCGLYGFFQEVSTTDSIRLAGVVSNTEWLSSALLVSSACGIVCLSLSLARCCVAKAHQSSRVALYGVVAVSHDVLQFAVVLALLIRTMCGSTTASDKDVWEHSGHSCTAAGVGCNFTFTTVHPTTVMTLGEYQLTPGSATTLLLLAAVMAIMMIVVMVVMFPWWRGLDGAAPVNRATTIASIVCACTWSCLMLLLTPAFPAVCLLAATCPLIPLLILGPCAPNVRPAVALLHEFCELSRADLQADPALSDRFHLSHQRTTSHPHAAAVHVLSHIVGVARECGMVRLSVNAMGHFIVFPWTDPPEFDPVEEEEDDEREEESLVTRARVAEALATTSSDELCEDLTLLVLSEESGGWAHQMHVYDSGVRRRQRLFVPADVLRAHPDVVGPFVDYLRTKGMLLRRLRSAPLHFRLRCLITLRSTDAALRSIDGSPPPVTASPFFTPTAVPSSTVPCSTQRDGFMMTYEGNTYRLATAVGEHPPHLPFRPGLGIEDPAIAWHNEGPADVRWHTNVAERDGLKPPPAFVAMAAQGWWGLVRYAVSRRWLIHGSKGLRLLQSAQMDGFTWLGYRAAPVLIVLVPLCSAFFTAASFFDVFWIVATCRAETRVLSPVFTATSVPASASSSSSAGSAAPEIFSFDSLRVVETLPSEWSSECLPTALWVATVVRLCLLAASLSLLPSVLRAVARALAWSTGAALVTGEPGGTGTPQDFDGALQFAVSCITSAFSPVPALVVARTVPHAVVPAAVGTWVVAPFLPPSSVTD